MQPILIVGTSIVNLALVSYSVFFYFERKTRTISSKVLTFLTVGVLLDLTATICMILGSSKGAFTLHGIVGYSSLFAMLIDALMMWKVRLKTSINVPIPQKLHTYSLIAYIWWICAYITGALLVMAR